MSIRKYIFNLTNQMREGTASVDARTKLAYARAYMQGEEGLNRYRDRAIASKIAKVYNQDAQLAILFNKDTHPDEYGEYQMFRAECKSAVDAEMAALKAELENALKEV